MSKKKRTVSKQQQQVLDDLYNALPPGRAREEALHFIRRGFLSHNALRRLKRGYKKLKPEYYPGVAFEGEHVYSKQDVDRLLNDG